MYLLSHTIKNFACFEDINLDFTDDNGDPCKWVVIVGENGTGKSTVLKSIAYALDFHNEPRDQHLTGAFGIKNLARQSAAGFFEFHARRSNRDRGTRTAAHISFGISNIRGGAVALAGSHSGDTSGSIASALSNQDITAGWFSAAYVPWRSRVSPALAAAVSKDTRSRSVRYGSLFGFDGYLPDISEWFWDLEASVNKAKNGGTTDELEKATRIFELAKASIIRILPDRVQFSRVTMEQQAVFVVHGREVEYKLLPDGYHGAIVWVADLVRCLVEAYPDLENPLEADGVVLVDEIDLRLHPSWQRNIVDKLRTLFPNIQFIVTTHSPFIVQDMTDIDKIIVLQWDGDNVIANEDAGFVHGWRVDQILTSRLFGLPTTRGDDVEMLKVDQEALIRQLGRDGKLTAENQERLDDISRRIIELSSRPDDFQPVNGNGSKKPPANGSGKPRGRKVAKP